MSLSNLIKRLQDIMRKDSGGTAYTLRYAQQEGLKIVNTASGEEWK